MKTIIYSYKDRKPFFLKLDRFYRVNTKKQLSKLIERFLEIDAVCTPANLKLPCILELQSGFSITFTLANLPALQKELEQASKLISLNTTARKPRKNFSNKKKAK